MKENEEIKENEFVEKKSKAVIKVIVIITILLLLVLGFGYFFYYYLDASKFLDNVSNRITKLVDNYSMNSNMLSIKNNDLNLKGDLDLKVNNSTTGAINYDIQIPKDKDYVNMNLGLNVANEKLIEGNIYYQDSKVYVEEKNLYDGIIEVLDIDSKKVKESLKDIPDISNIDINYMTKSLIKYYFSALKEGDLKTNIKSLMEKEYVISIDKINKENASEKFEKLIKEDEKLNSIFPDEEKFYDVFFEAKFIVRINVYTNKIVNFKIEANDKTLEGKYQDDKYVLDGNNNHKINLWLDKRLRMEYYVGEELRFVGEVNEKNILIKIDNEGKELNVRLNVKDKNTSTLEADYFDGTSDYKITSNLTKKSAKESEVKASLEVTTLGLELVSNFNFTTLVDKNLATKKTITSSKNIDELDDEEKYEIMLKFTEIMGKLNLSEI